jgi:hypothetical protein
MFLQIRVVKSGKPGRANRGAGNQGLASQGALKWGLPANPEEPALPSAPPAWGYFSAKSPHPSRR